MKHLAVFLTIYLAQVICGGNGATLDTLQAQIAECEKTLHHEITQTKSSIEKGIAKKIQTITSRTNAIKKEMTTGSESCRVWISQADFITRPLNNKNFCKQCELSSEIGSLEYRTDAALQEVKKNVERLNAICRLLIYNCEPQLESVSGDLKMFHTRVVADLGNIKFKSSNCVFGKLKPIKDGLENIYNEWKTCK